MRPEPVLKTIHTLAAAGRVRSIDYAFARFVAGQVDASDEVVLAACLVSQQAGKGNVCIDLAQFSGNRLFDPEQNDVRNGIVAPDYQSWTSSLQKSQLIGRPGDQAPLILDSSGRLYLAKYWQYESDLATRLKQRLTARQSDIALSQLKATLDRYFPVSDENEIDWQKIAAALTALQSFTIITGGPGTGKTTTITRILALLTELSGNVPLRITLTAPTGKAAARLSQSIRRAKTSPLLQACSEDSVLRRIPEEAKTLHRLLKMRPGRVHPYFNRDNALPADVVVLDEASMVDLPLMAKLVAAVPATARLILLGDRNQLFSVEAGKVFGDLCGLETTPGYSPELQTVLNNVSGFKLKIRGISKIHPIGNCIAVLKKTHRFLAGSGIDLLADAVNTGNVGAVLDILTAPTYPDVAWKPLRADALRRIANAAADSYCDYLQATEPLAAINRFERYRVLCALRTGPYGTEAANRAIESTLYQRGLIRRTERWYLGRPIMITNNDYRLNLFNGDIGLIMLDPETESDRRAMFNRSELESSSEQASNEPAGIRKVLPSRLSTHDTVYAMTVHKSQGSEFSVVDVILPPEPAQALTREVLYTAITRAQHRVRIWATRDSLSSAVTTKVARISGLRDALWE